jgi:hypothetical protein
MPDPKQGGLLEPGNIDASDPAAVTMVDRKGQRIEVPAEQATEAYNSGQYGFVGKEVPTVDQAGSVGMRAVTDLDAALDSGEQIASHQQFRQAHLEAKFGGIGGTLAAGGEGLARGASLGLSDPLAVGAARLFGGDQAAEDVRTHLAEEKEAHPILSTGAELVGAGAPMLLSGGATAPEQAATLGARAVGAAGEAGIFGRVAEGLGSIGRTLGAAPRGVGSVGDLAEHAVSGLLGGEAESALGRAGQAAAKTAARAMVEAGIFGGGEEISQDTLKNVPLTAEKLYSAVGHSALMGGLLGGGLAGAGSLVGSAAASALGAAGPKLDDLRGYQVWKWLSPRNAEAKLASRAGGPSAVGNAAWELAFRPAIEEKGIAAVAALPHEEKLGLIQDALDKVGQRIGQVDQSGATIALKDFLEPIDRRIEEHGKMLLGQDKVSVLQGLKDDVTRILGGADFQERELATVARKAAVDAGYEAGSEAGQQFEARYLERLKAGNAYNLGDAQIPIADALKQRRALQQIAFQENKAFDPKLRVQILRDISSDWNDLEAKSLDEAAGKAGEGITGDQFRSLNKQFQQLKVAETTIQNTTSRYAANNSLSLSDNLYGALHFGGAIAAGHPLGALGAMATAYGHKAVRMQGNAYAAILLDKLSTWGGVARATADVNGAIDKAIGQIVSAPEKAGVRLPRAFATSTEDYSEDAYEEARSRVAALAAMAPGLIAGHLQEKTAPLQTHAPDVAIAMQKQAQRANAYLVQNMPPLPPLDPLQGKRGKGSGVNAQQRNSFIRRVNAVEGGTEHIVKQLSKGRLSLEDVDVMQHVFQNSLPEVQEKLRQAAGDSAATIPYQRRLQIAMLLGTPTDNTMDPVAGQQLQQLGEIVPEHESETGAPSRAPAKLAIQESLATPIERAAASA